jgi:chromosome partitioning protein
VSEVKRAKAHIIVVGNEKGGAGKTTTSMHLIINLLYLGFKVASFDVDSRQLSLTRYIENRQRTNKVKGLSLPMPIHYIIREGNSLNIDNKNKEEKDNFLEFLVEAMAENDFVVIDTPGSHTNLSVVAHSHADTVVTPINDSFLDLDVLAKVEAETYKIIQPSVYSQAIWEEKLARAKRDSREIDWVLLRNRINHVDSKNKRNMGEVLEKLSHRIGFRLLPGFGERVIFKELFLNGVTLLDVKPGLFDINISMSHVAARQELRGFIKALNIKIIDEKLAQQTKILEEA